MVLRRFGIEDVESHAGEPPRLKRRESGVKINQRAATAVDQDGSGPYAIKKCLVDELMGFCGQGYVQRHDVACRGERRYVGRRNLRRRRAEWVVREQVHPEHRGELAHPPPDSSV